MFALPNVCNKRFRFTGLLTLRLTVEVKLFIQFNRETLPSNLKEFDCI